MITGATGIVGALAVALAADAGARVTAVARADAADKLRALGAREVVATPTDASGRFALILESSGGETLKGAIARVAPGGVIVVYGNTSREPTPFAFADFATAQNARIETLFHFTAEPEPAFAADLALIAARLGAGKLAPEISGVHDWTELPAVIKEMRSARFRGKPVFRVKAA
jgi:NADPH:quinone reductase-like Zn-dependent oxidoreductase